MRESDSKRVCVDGHAHHRIRAERIECVDLLLIANATGYDELLLREFAQARGGLDGKALHHAFAVNMRIEKCSGMRLKLRHGIVGREGNFGLPALYGDAAILGINTRNNLIGANGSCKVGR